MGYITEDDVQIRSIAYWATVVIDRLTILKSITIESLLSDRFKLEYWRAVSAVIA